MVGLAVSPECVIFHESFLVTVSNVAVITPVPLASFGGTSFEPFRSTLKLIVSDCATSPESKKSPRAIATILESNILVLMDLASSLKFTVADINTAIRSSFPALKEFKTIPEIEK